MRVPLFRVHAPPGMEAGLGEILRSGRITQGAEVAQFEALLRGFLGAEHLCAMSEGSAALTVALYIAGVRPGDEVVVSPLSCLATTMPIANLFAQPVWCDVDPETGMPDAQRIGACISERTRAVLAYHWSGNLADLDALRRQTRSRGIKLVVDASEAFGAEYGGRRIGAPEADFTVFSFSAVRHITTGEGAAVVVEDPDAFEQLRRLRRYGIDPESFRLANGDLNPASDIALAGYNFAMNNLCAAMGLAQMAHAEDIVQRHRDNGRFYDAALAGVSGLRRLAQNSAGTSAYWTYSLRAERRGELMRKLHEHGVGAQRLHLRCDRYGCYAAAVRPDPLPGVEIIDAENLSIPCGWWVGREEREFIAECIRSGW